MRKREPRARLGLHFHFLGNQVVQHRLHVGHQAVIAHQVGDDVAHGPPDVAQDQVDDLGGGGGEAQDAQLMVHKDGGDAGAGQQVVHVVVGPRQVRHLGLQFGVDRGQFLIDRLQFLLGGLQFLIGGLQFLVDGLHLLVGGFELFVGGLQFLVGGLEILLLGPQFLLSAAMSRIGLAYRDWPHVLGCAGRPLLAARAAGSVLPPGRPDTGASRSPRQGPTPHGRTVRLTVVKSPLVLTRRPGRRTISFCHGRLVQGRGQVAPQPFAGHLQDVVRPASPGAGSRYMPVRPCR